MFTLRSIDDVVRIRQYAKELTSARTTDSSNQKPKVVIIGAGLIGLEAAEAFCEAGLDITVVEYCPSVLPQMIDPDMAAKVLNKLLEHGVKVLTGHKVVSVNEENFGSEKSADTGSATEYPFHEAVRSVQVEEVIPGDRETHAQGTPPSEHIGGSKPKRYSLECGMLIIAAGQRPNTAIAEAAGIAVGRTKGIVVDAMCRTNIEGIFACGDCTEFTDFLTEKPVLIGMGTIAARQGKVAGINAAGGKASLPEGVLNTRCTNIFGCEIAAAGPLISSIEKVMGKKPVIATMTASSLPHYFPGGEEVVIKIAVDPDSRRILAAQCIGKGAYGRINTLAAAILNKMDVRTLAWLETCYAPPVAPTFDALTLVCDMAVMKMERGLK